MLRRAFLFLAVFIVAGLLPVFAQSTSSSGNKQDDPNMQNQAPPRSDPGDSGESSSRDTRIDLSPPMGDSSSHPYSGGDVMEMHPWNPHKADKDVEVGDYYFKLKNYRAAESRYREALEYMDNDAEAMYKLGVVLERVGKTSEARLNYENYLKILPEGPFAEQSKAAITRMDKGETEEPKPEPKSKKKK